MAIKSKEAAKRRQRRRYRIKKKLALDPTKARVTVFRSSRYIYAQVIDDIQGKTLASISTQQKSVRENIGDASTKSVSAAKTAGLMLGEKLKELGLETGVFDRSGFRYTGRVQALAEGLRESGFRI